jgi:hypothetical protein
VTVAEVSSPASYDVVKEPRFGNSILHLSVTDPRERELAVAMKVRVLRREYIRRDFEGAGGQAPATVPPAAAPAATKAWPIRKSLGKIPAATLRPPGGRYALVLGLARQWA